jgi:hypothetical protein
MLPDHIVAVLVDQDERSVHVEVHPLCKLIPQFFGLQLAIEQHLEKRVQTRPRLPVKEFFDAGAGPHVDVLAVSHHLRELLRVRQEQV